MERVWSGTPGGCLANLNRARRRHKFLKDRCFTVKKGRRSEEHTSELQSQSNLVCRLLLEKKKATRKSLPAAISGKRELSRAAHTHSRRLPGSHHGIRAGTHLAAFQRTLVLPARIVSDTR